MCNILHLQLEVLFFSLLKYSRLDLIFVWISFAYKDEHLVRVNSSFTSETAVSLTCWVKSLWAEDFFQLYKLTKLFYSILCQAGYLCHLPQPVTYGKPYLTILKCYYYFLQHVLECYKSHTKVLAYHFHNVKAFVHRKVYFCVSKTITELFIWQRSTVFFRKVFRICKFLMLYREVKCSLITRILCHSVLECYHCLLTVEISVLECCCRILQKSYNSTRMLLSNVTEVI